MFEIVSTTNKPSFHRDSHGTREMYSKRHAGRYVRRLIGALFFRGKGDAGHVAFNNRWYPNDCLWPFTRFDILSLNPFKHAFTF